MRDYTGIVVSDIDDPRVRHKLAAIDYYLRDLTRGLGSISKGLVPDGSGTTIINVSPLSDIYLVLLGRSGNQVAHGGTSPSGTLTLASTTNSTKGKVYLGNAQTTVFDEVNERIGIATAGPAAKLHIKVSDPAQQLITTTAGAGNSDWGFAGGATSLNDGVTVQSDGKYTRWDASVGFNSALTYTFPSATDPGTDSGFVMNFSLRSSTIAVGETMQTTLKSGVTIVRFWDIGFNGNTYGGADFNVGTTFAATALSLTSAEAALLNFGNTWTMNMTVGGINTGTFDIDYVRLDVPAAGSSDTLQKWESTSTSNTLLYSNDGNSNKSLVLAGGRVAISATAFAITEGSPAAGMIGTSTDGIGTFAWASASGLATVDTHEWVANGPYRVGDEVDSAWIPARNMTLSDVRLYRRVGGTSGSTQVTITRNGTTMLSANPSVAFNAGASATASGGISVTAISAGDRIAVSAVSADLGLPRDAAWRFVARCY